MAKLKTGRHTSALKENRKNIKRRKLNSSKKSLIKTLCKKVLNFITEKNLEKASEALKNVSSISDKSAKTNCISKGRANRIKARLSKLVYTASKS